MATFQDRWLERTVNVEAGELTWTDFPGPRPFLGCIRLAGRPISPVEGHRLLAEIAHPAAVLDYIGSGWG